jgi:hypothetical protein
MVQFRGFIASIRKQRSDFSKAFACPIPFGFVCCESRHSSIRRVPLPAQQKSFPGKADGYLDG